MVGPLRANNSAFFDALSKRDAMAKFIANALGLKLYAP